MMKNCFYFLFVSLFISSCNEDNFIPKWNKIEIGGWIFNQLILPNNVKIFCDSNYQLVGLESLIGDSNVNKLFFYQNGELNAKEKYNSKDKLEGKNYSFHENGDLKSIVTYKNGKKVDYGFDYYKNSGNLQNYIFYDTSGIYYYAENYSDTSIDIRYNFNPKNPNSYRLIKAKIPEPQKSQLLKIMEGIGLDSLNQVH